MNLECKQEEEKNEITCSQIKLRCCYDAAVF